jgi:hypothetical protein
MNKAHAIITAHGQTLDGWEGSDACLEISLLEHGMIWRREGEDFRFIFTAPNWTGDESKVWTDWGWFAANTDPEKEWSWALTGEKLESFLSCRGFTLEEFQSLSLPWKVRELVGYWGTEEIFGSSYYPTLTEFPEEEENEE